MGQNVLNQRKARLSVIKLGLYPVSGHFYNSDYGTLGDRASNVPKMDTKSGNMADQQKNAKSAQIRERKPIITNKTRAKASAESAPKPRRPTLTKKMREAVLLRIHEGLTITEACERVGVSPSGYFKAIAKPENKAFEQEEKLKLINAVDGMKAAYAAIALEHGRYLMHNAKSETVQARMVEFLAGQGPDRGNAGPSVAVQINNNGFFNGYEYPRPGQQVVEIVQRDSPSGDAGNEGEQ